MEGEEIAPARRAGPRAISWPFILTLATLVYLDWHLARPEHHRFSLGWENHWAFVIVFFGAAGRYAGYRWHGAPWAMPLLSVAIALVLAQGVEPVLESLYYDHAFAYDVEPERWSVFRVALIAGLPSFLIMYGLMRARFGPAPEGRS